MNIEWPPHLRENFLGPLQAPPGQYGAQTHFFHAGTGEKQCLSFQSLKFLW